MTDLTLNEYKDISEDVLKFMIEEEGKKMSGADFPDKEVFKKTPCFRLFSFFHEHISRLYPFINNSLKFLFNFLKKSAMSG